jgi:ribosomal protein S18 acetylase RimI-like enzyme
VTIHDLPLPASAADLDALAELLRDAVAGGASVSFRPPLATSVARAFWAKGVEGATTLVTRDDGGAIVGCVQLRPAWAPNQPHRADVVKLLVRSDVRRRGLGRRLMETVEDRARTGGFSLLTLHTRAGGAEASLYARLGWRTCGVIPGYVLDAAGAPADTVFLYKPL